MQRKASSTHRKPLDIFPPDCRSRGHVPFRGDHPAEPGWWRPKSLSSHISNIGLRLDFRKPSPTRNHIVRCTFAPMRTDARAGRANPTFWPSACGRCFNLAPADPALLGRRCRQSDRVGSFVVSAPAASVACANRSFTKLWRNRRSQRRRMVRGAGGHVSAKDAIDRARPNLSCMAICDGPVPAPCNSNTSWVRARAVGLRPSYLPAALAFAMPSR